MTTMKAPKSSRAPRQTELEGQDLTQEIESPLEEARRHRDEPTLSRVDFEDIEIALDL
jgi:hypothetical protein